MTPDPACAQATDDEDAVYARMQSHGVSYIPVLDGEKIVGIASARDLIQRYQNRLETEFFETRRRIEDLERLADLKRDDRLRVLMDEIERYRELSATDPLTGLYNKRTFAARLAEEVSRASRYRGRLSLIFCDIDFFKRVNDGFGHGAGDLVLQQVAAILAGSRLRKSDILARYGGEEFSVMLPDTDIESAMEVAERLHACVADEPIETQAGPLYVQMSIGVAGLQPDTISLHALINRADQAMYKAKDAGRNRVAMK
jgi:diguanylate cyclase (GGDEF)-like protein